MQTTQQSTVWNDTRHITLLQPMQQKAPWSTHHNKRCTFHAKRGEIPLSKQPRDLLKYFLFINHIIKTTWLHYSRNKQATTKIDATSNDISEIQRTKYIVAWCWNMKYSEPMFISSKYWSRLLQMRALLSILGNKPAVLKNERTAAWENNNDNNRHKWHKIMLRRHNQRC